MTSRLNSESESLVSIHIELCRMKNRLIKENRIVILPISSGKPLGWSKSLTERLYNSSDKDK